jgi:steroid delta-isomerase-like uncharacterized protein
MERTVTDATTALIQSYYAAFNRQDTASMLALLADHVIHEPSQGDPRHGKAAFAEFLKHMNRCYAETVFDPVVMVGDGGSRAAAEFMLDGQYLTTDEGLPAAHGQAYRLRVGAFFEIESGQIARVTNHYNLADWVRQVEAG